MGLSAKLCIFQPLSGNTRQLPALSGALGQGGNSHAGRAGLRELLPSTSSVWFSHCLSQCQGLAPLGTGSEHNTSNNSFTITSASTPSASVSMLSTLHTHTHTSTLHTPSYWLLKQTLDVGSFCSHFTDKKTESLRSKVTCRSFSQSCSVHTTPRFQVKRKTFFQQSKWSESDMVISGGGDPPSLIFSVRAE